MKTFDLSEFARIPDFPFAISIGTLNRDFIRHTHTFLEIIVVLDGTAVHRVEEQRYQLEKGDVFVVDNHMAHSFEDCRGLLHCNLMFRPEYPGFQWQQLRGVPGFQAFFVAEPAFRREHDFHSKLHLDAAQLTVVRGVLEQMYRAYCAGASSAPFEVSTAFVYLLTFFASVYADNAGGQNRYIRQVSRFSAILEKIDTRYREPLTVDALAGELGYSVRHFSRLFRTVCGVSPLEYIIGVRLEKAAELLCSTGISVEQAAAQCGFANSSYFHRQFKQKYGLPPGRYRRRQRKP